MKNIMLFALPLIVFLISPNLAIADKWPGTIQLNLPGSDSPDSVQALLFQAMLELQKVNPNAVSGDVTTSLTISDKKGNARIWCGPTAGTPGYTCSFTSSYSISSEGAK
jgi:hypothetical protein